MGGPAGPIIHYPSDKKMETAGFTGHISRQYNEDMEKLRTSVLEMGGLVEQQIEGALEALVRGDSELGLRVANNDDGINGMEVAIDDECNRVLALRAPTASDLRLIIAIIKTITDLERMGDEAKRIAVFAVQLAGMERPPGHYREISNLGNLVRRMVRASLDAFARVDEQAAAVTKKEDRAIDEEYEGISRQSVTFMLEDPRSIGRVLDVMWVVRALERIGDHAKNVCEHVVYMAYGKTVAHSDIEEAAAAVKHPK